MMHTGRGFMGGTHSCSSRTNEPILQPGAHYIRITTACNHNCAFCNVDRSRPVSPAQVADAIKRIPPSAREVVITGGEPTLHKDLVKYLRAVRAASRGKVTLQSNGALFFYEKFAEEIAGRGLADRIVISLPSHKPDLYARLTGGRFEHVTGALHNLARTRAEIVLNYLINAANHQDTAGFAQWLTQQWANRFGVLFSTVIPAARAAEDLSHMVRYSETVPALAQAADTLGRARVRFLIAGMYGIPPCILGRGLTPRSEMQIHLNANCHAETGVDRFVRGAPCDACRFGAICPGVWDTYAARFGTGELTPVPAQWKLPLMAPPAPADRTKRFVATLDRLEKGLSLDGNFVVWSITERCNCACRMCAGTRGNRSIGDFLDADRIRTICADLRALGFRKMLVCGGEPTLVEETPVLIRSAKQSGFQVFLNTNALLLESRITDYLEAGLDVCMISLDSADARIHDAIRGVPGLHARVLESAGRLADAGCDLRFHSVLMRNNIAGITGMVDLAVACRAQGLDFTFVFDEKQNDRSALRPGRKQILDFFLRSLPAMVRQALAGNLRLHVSPMPVELFAAGDTMEAWPDILRDPANRASLEEQATAFSLGRYNAHYLRDRICSACHRNLTIDFDGTVYPCAQSTVIAPDFRIGDLTEKRIPSLWNSAPFKRFRLQAPRHACCSKCFAHSRETRLCDELLLHPRAFMESL